MRRLTLIAMLALSACVRAPSQAEYKAHPGDVVGNRDLAYRACVARVKAQVMRDRARYGAAAGMESLHAVDVLLDDCMAEKGFVR